MESDFVNQFKAEYGIQIKLKNYDPDFTAEINKDYAENVLENDLVNRLSNLQYKLFADKNQSILIILQGVDTSGKDGTIRNVMKAFNPQSCKVVSFKKPNDKEISHDYLWRIHKFTPVKGEIMVFNRSHYEDVLSVRVNKIIPEAILSKRYNQINDFERYLFENNIKIIKLFLHISKGEQKKRLEERIKDPLKQWKISESDIIGYRLWKQYILAYEEMLSKCSTNQIPWHIIPANNKWFRNFTVAKIIINTLENMDLKFPKPKIDVSKILM
jgi:PPK2 family polyphosphate:nucleotide phosphotransferase